MAVSEGRPNKIVKKSNQKKTSRSLDIDIVAGIVEDSGGNAENGIDGRKPQGIVIDGRTYTCATCKAGHRVGVCKHARERPMKATHPPGRPPAGAPKKITCDCPKSCNCKKKDCKCARNCSCIQSMYMLVYVPAPGEDENPEEEKGSWKLGEQVMTDLKGNILTPDQVRWRQQTKEARKIIPTGPDSRSRSTSIVASHPSPASASPETETKAEVQSCCKHKEAVAAREAATQITRQSGRAVQTPAGGCNCGSTCSCAFCPEHPNNSTSVNVARQQAMFMANNFNFTNHSLVPFAPSVPQNISCMGGQPQFAISRNSERPSPEDIFNTFGNRGFFITYPIHQHHRPGNVDVELPTYAMTSADPFPEPHDLTASSRSLRADPYDPVPASTPTSLQFEGGDFDVGAAFVASSGVPGWHNALLGADPWTIDDPIQSTNTEQFHATGFMPNGLETGELVTLPNQMLAPSQLYSQQMSPAHEHPRPSQLQPPDTVQASTPHVQHLHPLSPGRQSDVQRGALPSTIVDGLLPVSASPAHARAYFDFGGVV